MSNGTTEHTPADTRERVAREVFALDEDWRREYWLQFRREYPLQAGVYYDTADRILALLRTPRGEGEAGTWGDTPFAAFVVWWQQRFGDVFINPRVWCYTKAEKAHLAAQRLKENGVPVVLAVAPAALRSESQGEEDAVRRTWELAVRRAYGCLDYRGGYRGAELEAFHAGIKTVIRALEAGPDAADTQAAALDRIGAALRSEANGKEADALDMIRWAESHGAALEPVAGNLTPPGTYACYVEGVGDDPAEYEDAGEPYMGPGILGAIRAARRSEGGGK